MTDSATTAPDAPDSPDWGEPRSRTVTWHDPLRSAQAGLAMAGIDYLHLRGLGTPADGRLAARSGRHADMRRIFEAHLATDPAQQEFAELVRLVASGQPLCLLCFERHADHCHRRILTERLTERLGARIVDLAP